MSAIDVWSHEPWLRFGVTVIAALLLALVLRRLIWAVLGRLGRHYPLAGDLLRRASAPAAWVLPLLLLVVLYARPEQRVWGCVTRCGTCC